MKNIFSTFLLVVLLISCAKEESNSKVQPVPPNKGPQAIVMNKSIVKAEILEVLNKDERDFILKIRALEVKENSNYESIAVAGETYKLKPNYSLDPLGNPFNNEKNMKLRELASLNKGDKINLEITYSGKDGWLINKVLQWE